MWFIVILIILTMLPISASAAKNSFAADDPNIKYIGRWIKNEGGFMEGSFECSAVIRFTGTSLTLAAKSNYDFIYVRVDGGECTQVRGSRRLARGLSQGEHTLEIFASAQKAFPIISGIELDEGAELLPVEDKPVIEFIGDSILQGYTVENSGAMYSYGSFVADNLGFYRNIVAFGGLAVVEGYGGPDNYGIIKRYSMRKEYTPEAPESEPWDHSKFIPDYVVINLGTNDSSSPSKEFEETYSAFLKQLHNYYKDAKIFVMIPFNGTKKAEITRAFNANKDENTFLIESNKWLIPKGKDALHPDNNGHKIITNKLTPVLQELLATPDPNATQAPTNTSAPNTQTPNDDSQQSADVSATPTASADNNGKTENNNNGFIVPLIVGAVVIVAIAIGVIIFIKKKNA